MLALSRRSGEEIVLTLPNGERIAVKVFRIMSDKVRIAIDAPGDVTIHRGEVQQRIDNGESFARSGHDGPDDGTDDPA